MKTNAVYLIPTTDLCALGSDREVVRAQQFRLHPKNQKLLKHGFTKGTSPSSPD